MHEWWPIVSKLESAATHDRWFRDKVAVSVADDRAAVAYDQVLAENSAIIAAKCNHRVADGHPARPCVSQLTQDER